MTQNGPQPVDLCGDARRPVFWRARLTLESGEARLARITHVSDQSFGITTDQALPVLAVLEITVSVADLTDRTGSVEVSGQVRIVHSLLKGHDFLAGAEWIEIHEPGRTAWAQWLRKLNRPAPYGTVTSMKHL